jgi:hypothetical protein
MKWFLNVYIARSAAFCLWMCGAMSWNFIWRDVSNFLTPQMLRCPWFETVV